MPPSTASSLPVSIIVHEATLADAQLIADLTRAAWANRVAVTSSAHHETACQVSIHLRDGGGFVLLANQEPVGSVRWLPCETEPQVWDILRMGILPAFRGMHLSQHLIEAVIHHALESGTQELRLAIRTDQPNLVDFYTAFGFEIAPELEYEHANPLEPAPHVMRKFL
jgi:ribosomal protein S18 acetylase RimI-like enzyme